MIYVPLSPSALWFVPHSCSLCCIIACDTVLQPPVALGQLYAALLTLNSIQFIWLSYLFARRPFGQRKIPCAPTPRNVSVSVIADVAGIMMMVLPELLAASKGYCCLHGI